MTHADLITRARFVLDAQQKHMPPDFYLALHKSCDIMEAHSLSTASIGRPENGVKNDDYSNEEQSGSGSTRQGRRAIRQAARHAR